MNTVNQEYKMTIEINEKPRMTKDNFVKKYTSCRAVPRDYNQAEDMLADLNSLLGEQQEETVEYPCLMVSKHGNLYYMENKVRGYSFICENELDIEKADVLVATLKPFHGTITIKQ